MGKLSGYLRLIRPVNCLMMGFAVTVGAALASPNVSSVFWPNLFYGFITGFMLTAASMTINDYYDREIDAINEPNRPIPSGLIKPYSHSDRFRNCIFNEHFLFYNCYNRMDRLCYLHYCRKTQRVARQFSSQHLCCNAFDLW
jgi:hypothetical protein